MMLRCHRLNEQRTGRLGARMPHDRAQSPLPALDALNPDSLGYPVAVDC